MMPKPMIENATVSRIAPAQAATLGGLARMAAAAFSEFREGAGAADRLRHYFEDYVSAVWEANASAGLRYEAIDRTYRRRLQQAYSARDFIFANLHEPISMARLCAAIGTSRRQLEYAFQDAFGLNPRQFIRLRRLNDIRRALLRPQRPSSVTEVALEHGVTHLSRFATNYRALFGESPRQTLAASRTRR
jgi:AraC-like DNA-binding protein